MKEIGNEIKIIARWEYAEEFEEIEEKLRTVELETIKLKQETEKLKQKNNT